jgi:hypothetical protein
MKSSKSAKQSQFGPLQKKTFASALDRFFEEQCPQLGGHLTRQVIVNNVQSLVEEFYPPHSHLRMGQVMWPAVDENETAAYGKSIEKTKLKPVFVDMIAPEDIEAMLKGEKAKLIRQRAAVRLFEQAKEQQAVFTGVDVATMMRLSPATISNYVRDWEKQNQTSVPRRGTIHDMGRLVVDYYPAPSMIYFHCGTTFCIVTSPNVIAAPPFSAAKSSASFSELNGKASYPIGPKTFLEPIT